MICQEKGRIQMASIREKKKGNKVVSFHFIACLGRDAAGKQIRKYNTWTPPEGLTPAKARKTAERAADTWEQEIINQYRKEQEAACGVAYITPPEKRRDDFCAFINENWFPLHIRRRNLKNFCFSKI